MYLYTNNHFEGKAAANAVMLRDKLGLPTPGAFPPAFVEHYPQLQGIVQTTSAEASADLFAEAPVPAAAPKPRRSARKGA
jgi:hypothetical protein